MAQFYSISKKWLSAAISPQPNNNGNINTEVRNIFTLILLSGPDETSVPRQGARVLLVENGHVINACRFTKDLSDALVETTIIEAFEGKIPPNVDIELLMSVHTSLVQPTLAPGQCGIDGVILHRLLKQKPVYVRPSRVLLNTRTDCQVNIFSLIIFCAHFYPFCSHTVFAPIKVSPLRGGAGPQSINVKISLPGLLIQLLHKLEL